MSAFLVVLGSVFVVVGFFLGRREQERPPVEPSLLREMDELLRTGLGTISEALAILLASRPPDAEPKAPPPEPEAPVPPGNREVYALADEGLGAGEIAKRLHRHRGEIDLILRLRGLGH